MPHGHVVRSATSIAADVLGQEDLGQVRKGFLADLIVVAGDPTNDIGVLKNPLLVVKDGAVVKNDLDKN